MTKQFILFLISICTFLSCKEGNNAQEQTTIADAPTNNQQTPIAKEHPAEEKIAFYLSQIEKFRGANEYDSLEAANRSLMVYLKEACLDETFLQYPMEKLENTLMNVLTSADKKFRIYCWDTETGGTMHFYNAIAQYRSGSSGAAYVLNDIGSDGGDAERIEEGDSGCGVWYDSLHTITANDKTYYLAVHYGRYSGNDHTNGISAYAIENGKLNDKPRVFKPKGKPLQEISYYYQNGSVGKMSTDHRIHLSKDKQTLYIPVADKDNVVTEKYLIYKFDGNQFVFDKNAQ